MIRDFYWKIEPTLKRPASMIYEKRAIEMLWENTDLAYSDILEILRYAKKLSITSREYVEHGYWRFPVKYLVKIRNERVRRWQVAERLAAEILDTPGETMSFMGAVETDFAAVATEADFVAYDSATRAFKNREIMKRYALEIERDMLELRFNNEVRASEYEILGWHRISQEQRKQMLTKKHSRELSHRYRRQGFILNGTRNKAFFNRHFEDMLGRRWFENDGLSFEEFLEEIYKFRTDSFFYKPVFGSMGIEVRKFDLTKGNLHKIYRKIRNVHGVAEESICQHRDMQSLCSDCVNTVRIASLVDFEEKVHILWGSCRVGCGNGQPVDNASQGGLRISVDSASGKMDSMAVDCTEAVRAKGDPAMLIERHPVTGTKFMGFQIPYWDEVLSLVEEAAIRALEDFGLGFVGWDIAITPTGPVIIEGNNCPAVATVQYPRFLQYGEGMKHLVSNWL